MSTVSGGAVAVQVRKEDSTGEPSLDRLKTLLSRGSSFTTSTRYGRVLKIAPPFCDGWCGICCLGVSASPQWLLDRLTITPLFWVVYQVELSFSWHMVGDFFSLFYADIFACESHAPCRYFYMPPLCMWTTVIFKYKYRWMKCLRGLGFLFFCSIFVSLSSLSS